MCFYPLVRLPRKRNQQRCVSAHAHVGWGGALEHLQAVSVCVCVVIKGDLLDWIT